ncbi:type II restriction endonuclease subunit M [Cobetia sp. UIB-001]
MSQFLRLLGENDKAKSLAKSSRNYRNGSSDHAAFELWPSEFKKIPGAPFAYWVSDEVRNIFSLLPALEGEFRYAQHGGSTKNDFRFLRLWWEEISTQGKWFNFAKGGAYAPYYADVYLLVNWKDNARELEASLLLKYPYLGDSANWVLHRECSYFSPGLTWSLRTQAGFCLRVMPADCIFSHKGPAVFVGDHDHEELLALLALSNSSAFELLVSLQMAFGSYEVGVIQRTPVPELDSEEKRRLRALANRAWSLKRTLDTVNESSHAFLLPESLRKRLSDYNPAAIHDELAYIQTQVDDIAFDLYGFSEEDRQAANGEVDASRGIEEISGEQEQVEVVLPLDALISWAAGVTFGRFDCRLATGEREAPPEPEPFDPLPAKSPGMLPDGVEPYHRHTGILVDDAGHEHDLPRLMADVLETVDAQVDEDLRRWLRRNFFKYHLQQYSKSRRKAPIYWPLAMASGNYTLWLYYPDLTDQTLFTAVNDFVEPKLKQVDSELGNLRLSGASRSRADEKRLEELSDFRDELADLRDTLLRIAPDYKPSHDDGVQITAAPLWPLFRHKPWQKVLKETWEKLEQGDYDWAHLAMAYWPERVREKCVTDKSLAIAHDLEHLYVEPESAPKQTRGRKKASDS